MTFSTAYIFISGLVPSRITRSCQNGVNTTLVFSTCQVPLTSTHMEKIKYKYIINPPVRIRSVTLQPGSIRISSTNNPIIMLNVRYSPAPVSASMVYFQILLIR